MALARRDLVRGLGAGILGAGALGACTRRRDGPPTPPPSAEPLTEPDTPLVIAQIGADHGRAGQVEEAVAVALDEARIDVNARWDGLFGHEVELLERHVVHEPGEDLAPVIREFAEAGATCVITSVDEETLIAAMPALVEAGMAVIDVLTSGMSVRSQEVHTANLLVRLSPDERTLAARYAEAALGSSSDRAGAPGTVALLSPDTAQGRSLLHELEQYLNPRNGRVLSAQFYDGDGIGDVEQRVQAVLEEPPALLVVEGGPETAPFLSALHEATLGENGRPEVQFPRRLGPTATVDYSRMPIAEDLAPECLSAATGYQPGGEVTVEHENMMLNRSAAFLETGYAYSQQAYDAFTMACLAAQHALSVTGTALAAALPAILTGAEECTDFDQCRRVMRTALEVADTATISYRGRMGKLELGPGADARVGELREYTWSEENALGPGTATGFEAPA
ncbi:ABC transporter substrate-binding protein [Brachybacterium saurashtrense]|uniref:Amino acid ABC transporter substrate-binding protein n=1 Tax=Brachybacterium saurashtrense TaxID=556288 RepID=A0A345YM76_9MICO|nr:ABC transporter substrate-binding protein [Brachybacterium saurashtrense]AXK45028.1 amino acid ABC transporter substrate-binding protein [Brachybacterium saurashtrense]RRR21712.1 amino acid ABC transporter substrate-binding protein [Brachybacterium saurashtrense]